jgi:hypothetical protein
LVVFYYEISCARFKLGEKLTLKIC